jgi:nucleoside-diphosphate-sugar epimerase
MNAASRRFVILGASSWLGHYVIPAIKSLYPNAEITGVFRSNPPSFQLPATVIQMATMDLINQAERLPQGTVISLNRGEEDLDFQLHKAIIHLQNKRHERYTDT